MNIETVFSLSTLSVMPFWLMMIVWPTGRITNRVMSSYWPMVAPAVVYCGILVFESDLGTLLPELANPSAAGMASLLGTPPGASAGWAHFLAFDLFVGRWVYLEARKAQTTWWLAAPTLLCTLMVAPVGFLLWLLVRGGAGGVVGADAGEDTQSTQEIQLA